VEKMKKFFKWGAIILVSLMVIGAFFGSNDSSKNSSTSSSSDGSSSSDESSRAEEAAARKKEIDEMELYTANDVTSAYAQNTVSADQMMKGKTIKLTGKVMSINTDFRGNPYLVVEGGVNAFMNPHFKFSKDQLSEIAEIQVDQKVKVLCVGGGDIAKTPMLDDCEFVD
jgi:hypothetical protein